MLTAALVAGSIFIAGPASIILVGAALGAAGGLIGGGISSGISSVMSGGSFIDSFAVGAYWIFRKVIINEDGIEIVSFKKQIYYFQWNQIVSIEMSNKNLNPSIEITSISNKKIYLDRRKKIIKAIVDYSKKYDNLSIFLNK